MQKTLQNISSVSFFFLLAFGFMHVGASFLLAQNVINDWDKLIFNVFDLPFLLSALIFASSRLSLRMGNIFGSEKAAFIVLSILSIILFLFALYLNFLIPDAKLG